VRRPRGDGDLDSPASIANVMPAKAGTQVTDQHGWTRVESAPEDKACVLAQRAS